MLDTPERESYTPDDEKAARKTKPRKLRGLDLRVQFIFSRPRVARARSCKTKKCFEETSGGKPYCFKCLGKMPYVKKLKAELAGGEA